MTSAKAAAIEKRLYDAAWRAAYKKGAQDMATRLRKDGWRPPATIAERNTKRVGFRSPR